MYTLQAIFYMFFTKPSPAFGIMDFYVFNPINSLVRKSYKVADLTLRERLGGGNYGQVSPSSEETVLHHWRSCKPSHKDANSQSS